MFTYFCYIYIYIYLPQKGKRLSASPGFFNRIRKNFEGKNHILGGYVISKALFTGELKKQNSAAFSSLMLVRHSESIYMKCVHCKQWRAVNKDLRVNDSAAQRGLTGYFSSSSCMSLLVAFFVVRIDLDMVMQTMGCR